MQAYKDVDLVDGSGDGNEPSDRAFVACAVAGDMIPGSTLTTFTGGGPSTLRLLYVL